MSVGSSSLFSSYVSSCSLSNSSMLVSVKSVSKGAKLLLICFLSEHETLLLLFSHLPLSLSFSSNFSPFLEMVRKGLQGASVEGNKVVWYGTVHSKLYRQYCKCSIIKYMIFPMRIVSSVKSIVPLEASLRFVVNLLGRVYRRKKWDSFSGACARRGGTGQSGSIKLMNSKRLWEWKKYQKNLTFPPAEDVLVSEHVQS